jgi:hypothetical protein
MATQARPPQSTKSTSTLVGDPANSFEPELLSHSLSKVARPLSKAPGIDDHRRELVAVTAYYLAERRGFAPDHAADDWATAEAMVDTALE